jgi:hypothetical protein
MFYQLQHACDDLAPLLDQPEIFEHLLDAVDGLEMREKKQNTASPTCSSRTGMFAGGIGSGAKANWRENIESFSCFGGYPISIGSIDDVF